MPSTSRQVRVGALLIFMGLVGFVLTVLDWVPADQGAAAAISMFLVIMGLVFYFPTLLDDGAGQTSSMRVMVLMIVSLFVILTLKVGWGADSLEDLVLSDSWIWVLAAALGGKAAQSYAENMGSAGNGETTGKGKAGKGAKGGGEQLDEQD
jgi:xanthine/uracil permease